MDETYPEATNFQYVDRGDFTAHLTVFMNKFDSYHGSVLVKKMLETQNGDGIVDFKVCGTIQMSEESCQTSDVTILNPDSESFIDAVINCDYIIYDISQDPSQLSMAQKFIKQFQTLLEESKITKKKHLVLISTIMTWAQTPDAGDDTLTDLNYRKRRPHPCFINHLALERDVINLQKKFKDFVSSVVVCPGIIYGGRQDIFHFLYKKCFFNNHEVEVFAPASNRLPLIHLEDFAVIMMMLLRNFPEPEFPYILAVQPGNLPAIEIFSLLTDSVGGPDVRVRICDRNEIFLMNEELMTVRLSNVSQCQFIDHCNSSNVFTII